MELGDIEDLGDGRLALICPWHQFDFCLDTGASSTGLQVAYSCSHILSGLMSYFNKEGNLFLKLCLSYIVLVFTPHRIKFMT